MPHTQNEKSQGQKDRWVFIVNNEVISADSTSDIQPSLCKLRHPRLDTGVMYLLAANCTRLFEVNCYKEKYRSWFIGNSVHSDGKIYMSTPVDPLFLVLPYLIGVREKSSQFRTLDQLVYDEDFPDCHKLLPCCSYDQLSLIADVKDLDDNLQVYQYSPQKTLSWLKIKTENLADALEREKVDVDIRGSRSSIFSRSKTSAISRDDYMEYAHGIISDYLPSALEKELRECLGLPDINASSSLSSSQTENEPPKKKTKLTGDVSPTDDYSKGFDTKKDKSKTGKLTIAQKRLSKVDKTGIKSISSFFSPKS